MNTEALNGLFRPKGVAVIGASNKAGKIGYSVVEALKNGKYDGEIFPINPKEPEIQGLTAYKSVLELKGKIDLAHQAPLSMDSPGKNTGVGCHFLLQGIFLTQG